MSTDLPAQPGPFEASDDAALPGRVVLPAKVVDAAIAWSIKLHHTLASEQARRGFDRWLAADPLHALAWQRVVSLEQPFRNVPAPLLHATLQAADARREQRQAGRRRATRLLSFGAMALGGAWLVREHTPWQGLLADATTGVGEQKSLQLADGTLVRLNTDSAISTELGGERRWVTLLRGEVQIVTGDDLASRQQAGRQRPFWVRTPFGTLQALGTRFVVRLQEQAACVSVQEGAVALHPASGASSAVARSGESLWLARDGTAPADSRGMETDGWMDGVIAGKNMRLADLLSELSRYRRGRIVCDERVADLRLSGLYQVADTDRTLRFLASTQPVELSYRTRFWVVVGPLREKLFH